MTDFLAIILVPVAMAVGALAFEAGRTQKTLLKVSAIPACILLVAIHVTVMRALP